MQAMQRIRSGLLNKFGEHAYQIYHGKAEALHAVVQGFRIYQYLKEEWIFFPHHLAPMLSQSIQGKTPATT